MNQKAPAIVVEKWLTKAPDLKGKFILIDFWATWCGPCKKSIPDLNEFHNKFGDKLIIVGLSREEEQTVRNMVSPAIHYYSAIDRAGRTMREVEVKAIPHAIILDPKGIVRWEGSPSLPGYELTEKVIQEIINKYRN